MQMKTMHQFGHPQSLIVQCLELVTIWEQDTYIRESSFQCDG